METRRPPSVVSALLPGGGDEVIEGTTSKIGDVIDGKYRITGVVGAGGMGVVVEAAHVSLGRKVAIKLLRSQLLQNAVVVARFEREAKAAVVLRSEHVARVIDVGRLPGGEPFMVMELLEGSNLDDLVERDGPLAPEVAADYVLQACEAIAEAHAIGIIHRDLKPHNLFLTKRVDGSPLVKVLDFGISKVPNEDSILTRSTDVMGSPLYMAPEQLQGLRTDARSDIWAIGGILFYLITGRTPFDGVTMSRLVSRVLGEKPRDIRKLRPDIPEQLAAAIERCLRKDPAERWPDVIALARAIDPLVPHRPVRPAERVVIASNRPPPPATPAVPPRAAARAQPSRAPRRRRTPLLLLGAGVLALVGVGIAASMWRPRTPAIVTPATPSASIPAASAESPSEDPSEDPAPPPTTSSGQAAPASVPPRAHPRQRGPGPKP
jgi:serine/threonine-protein kinase